MERMIQEVSGYRSRREQLSKFIESLVSDELLKSRIGFYASSQNPLGGFEGVPVAYRRSIDGAQSVVLLTCKPLSSNESAHPKREEYGLWMDFRGKKGAHSLYLTPQDFVNLFEDVDPQGLYANVDEALSSLDGLLVSLPSRNKYLF